MVRKVVKDLKPITKWISRFHKDKSFKTLYERDSYDRGLPEYLEVYLPIATKKLKDDLLKKIENEFEKHPLRDPDDIFKKIRCPDYFKPLKNIKGTVKFGAQINAMHNFKKDSKLIICTKVTGFNLGCDTIHLEFDDDCIQLVSNYEGDMLGWIRVSDEDIERLRERIKELDELKSGKR